MRGVRTGLPASTASIAGLGSGATCFDYTPGRHRHADLIFRSASFHVASNCFSTAVASSVFFCSESARERP